MSNQASSVLMRSIHRKPHHSQSLSQSDENCCGTSSRDIAPLLSRPPLNSITDPSQSPSGTPLHHFGCPSKDKLPTSISKKLDSTPAAHLLSSVLTTPKPYTRAKSSISEPNSAQTTPVRTRPRVSNAAASGLTVTRLSSQPGHGRAREGAAARDTALLIAEQLSACVPHFELEEDFSFWKDHNVQVLIRVRPLNNAEMISQGNGRCLRQESPRSLVWLGHPETRFTFDHIACESTSQEKLFRVAGLPMVDNCMSGYNSCMFAYGQTGSGKTYTMMGEIDDMDGTLSDDCGITPRIFEYLFSRITKEEENEKLGNLTYSCKCSFLEIYNEQITDLLEPSSINLQLREDLKKGVYVENLTEYNVRTVNDVLNLLKEGAANRKIAATNMNSESSRSHSVFTCIIESCWEKDSVTHRRFGRLNLVDLAGSERQKSSGADGDRLKEAANINKSLSTLGLVIMSLVDSVQGKHRHVPYRDSRLTFLLQDSLGGNSKTTIIANVSPSLCCANETLGTLKFAQRAKLIQNNAKINEDASGGAIALQMQIRQLKDQLSLLMKHQDCSMGPKNLVPPPKCTSLDHFPQSYVPFEEITSSNEHESSKKKHAGATLHGALRQEKLAEAEIRRLKTEIDVLNVLRDEEAQHMNMMLNFRDEKIKRLELLLEELMPVEKFYLEENNALREENFLLHAQIKKNPQVIQLELENTRLLEQIKVLQDFYGQGNRERLLTEISDPHSQESELSKELEECKDMNSNLIRNVDELREQLANGMNSDHDAFKSDNEGSNILALQSKLDKVSDNIMEAEILSRQYIEDCATPISHLHQQAELVRSEFEMEATRMINQLQEEIYRLQSEFQVCLCSVVEQNISLQNSVSAKEDEVKALCVEWEKATSELTSFLRGGSRSLWDASYEIKRISSLFPNVNDWISEHVSGAAKMCVEKEETILQLQKSLDDARSTVMQLEKKLYSLKDATIALTEFQQLENSLNGEEIQLSRKATDSKEVGELPGNKFRSCISDSQANTPTLLPVEEKHDSCSGSFPKFHEACATIKEVDCMLKGILKENDNTNVLVGMWKHAAGKLMIDEACLSEEIKGLKTRTLVGDKEKKQLLEELQFSFKEKVNIFSFVEHCFLAVETRIGELFESAPKMVIPVIEGMQMYFCSMRSSLEDLMCKALQNNISMFVVQCQIDEHCLDLGRLNKSSKSERCLFQEPWPVADNPELSQANEDGHPSVQSVKHESKTNQVLCVTREEIKECEAHSDGTEVSSAELKRELDRKEELLKGLHFDFSLLQEFASQRKDIKNELERLIGNMSNIQQDLLMKQAQLDSALVQKKHLERCLSEAELGLSHSNSELHWVKQELNILSKQTTELKDLLKDANLRNSKAEQLIDEQREAIKGLEREIIWLSSSSSEKQLVSSVKDVQFALLELTAERDQLIQKFNSLQDKHDATAALADENQAVATEARQESQASKIYAEQKQEEVKILEHSVEELETTINVMEKKLHEMEEEIENQRLTRDSLEREIQALRCRLQTVEDLTGSMMVENSHTSIHKVQLSKFQEVNEAHSRIRFLEVVNEKQAKQIGQLNDYIAELVLHAEAQATQYQQKYKTLEAMFHEVKTDLSNVPAAPNSEKLDGISARTRGLSSPFKCIAGMIQQMNQEKDHELSSARLRIEELELMAASRYKEVCTLNTRLATTESMTHDVIRDLLGVKLGISNYVDIIEQHQLQKLIDEAQHHRQELVAMEQEIFKMKSHINDLHEERDRCIAEINNNNTDQLATHIIMEQLQEQNHLLIAQNGILKMDKTNLQKKVAELDELLKNQFNGVSSSRPLNQPRMKYLLGSFDNNIAQRMAHSQNLLSRVNDQQHARHHRPNDDRMDTFGNDINFHVN